MYALCPADDVPESWGKKSGFLNGWNSGSCFCKLTGSEVGEDCRLRAKEQPGHTRAWQAMAERDMAEKGRKTRGESLAVIGKGVRAFGSPQVWYFLFCQEGQRAGRLHSPEG